MYIICQSLSFPQWPTFLEVLLKVKCQTARQNNARQHVHNKTLFFFQVNLAMYLFIYFHSNFMSGYGEGSLDAILPILQVMVTDFFL